MTLGANGQSVSCQVTLSTNNGETSEQCVAQVASNVCALDCAGKVNGVSTFDVCGVCGGSGTSCVTCDSVNVQNTQLAIDSNGSAQRNNILALVKEYEKVAKVAGLKGKALTEVNNFINASVTQGQSLYRTLWTDTYGLIPGVVRLCPSSSACVRVNLAPSISKISLGSKGLSDLAINLEKKIKALARKAKGSNAQASLKKSLKKASNLSKFSNQIYNDTTNQLSKIPTNTSNNC